MELLAGLNHYLAATESTCIKDHTKTVEQVLKDQGYGSFDEALALILKEPGKHNPLSAWPYSPEYLDLLEVGSGICGDSRFVCSTYHRCGRCYKFYALLTLYYLYIQYSLGDTYH